jgi:hypothetical protein
VTEGSDTCQSRFPVEIVSHCCRIATSQCCHQPCIPEIESDGAWPTVVVLGNPGQQVQLRESRQIATGDRPATDIEQLDEFLIPEWLGLTVLGGQRTRAFQSEMTAQATGDKESVCFDFGGVSLLLNAVTFGE